MNYTEFTIYFNGFNNALAALCQRSDLTTYEIEKKAIVIAENLVAKYKEVDSTTTPGSSVDLNSIVDKVIKNSSKGLK